jgi:hypothetical protein
LIKLIVLLAAAVISLSAQENIHSFGRLQSAATPTFDVEGQIVGSRPQDLSRLFVELVDLELKSPAPRIFVETDGRFRIPNIAPGAYELRVTTWNGEVVRREQKVIQAHPGRVEIRLPERDGSRPVTGTVSLQRLKIKVPKAAGKEFGRARQFQSAGDFARAISHLEKATGIEPRARSAAVPAPVVKTARKADSSLSANTPIRPTCCWMASITVRAPRAGH